MIYLPCLARANKRALDLEFHVLSTLYSFVFPGQSSSTLERDSVTRIASDLAVASIASEQEAMRWRSTRPLWIGPISHLHIQPGGMSRRAYSDIPSSKLNVASILALSTSAETKATHYVQVIGHVRTVRKQKYRSFVEIGDGSTIYTIQAMLDSSQAEGYVQEDSRTSTRLI